MSLAQKSRCAAVITTLTTLAAALTLGALPAQGAAVPGVELSPAKPTSYYIPADATTRIDFLNLADAQSAVFPAGKYLVSTASAPAYRYLGIETLSEKYGGTTTKYTLLSLSEDGPLSIELSETGPAGSLHWVDVYAVADDFPDPATLTNEEIWEHIEAARESGLTAHDQAALTVAKIDAPAVKPFPELTIDAANYMKGDAFGIGVDVEIMQRGNQFTAVGPDGAKKSMVFGRVGDEMVVGDWNGDGMDTVGLRRGRTIFLTNGWGGGRADHTYDFGRPGDQLLAGDWDGDGTDNVGLRRGNVFYLSERHTGGIAPIHFAFGRASDTPLIYDFHKTGKDLIGVVRMDGVDAIWDGTLHIADGFKGGAAAETHRVAD